MIKVFNFKSAYKPHTNIKVIVNNNSFKLGGHTFNLNYHENSISVTSKTFKIDTGISFENLPYIGDQDSPEISIFQNLIGKGLNQIDSKIYFTVTCDHMDSNSRSDKYRLDNELFTVKYHEYGNKGNGGWCTSHEVFGASHADYFEPIDCLKDLLARHGCTKIQIVEDDDPHNRLYDIGGNK